MKPQLIKKYREGSYSRWSENNTNYDKLVELVVLDVLELVQHSKPSKTQLTHAIKQYFGMEILEELQEQKHEHTNKDL